MEIDIKGIEFDVSDIDFDNINGTNNREKTFKDQLVTCPECGESFTVKI